MMRYLVLGMGAIGGYIGGSLALSGEDVVFVERGGVAENVQNQGLRLSLPTGDQTIQGPAIVEDAARALSTGPFDVAILAVKAYHTEALLKSIAGLRSTFPPILSLQNGVDNEPMIERVMGAGSAIRGTVTTAIGKPEPGVIKVERLRGVGIANEHPLSNRLVNSFARAGLKAKMYANGQAMKWSKMLTNLPANATSAILDWPPAAIYSHPVSFAIEIRQMNEAIAVMRMLNIPIVDLPGTPVKLMAVLASLPRLVSQPLLTLGLGKGRGGKMPSFHIDLTNGSKESEVRYLNGAIAREGEKLRIDVRTNRALTEILSQMANGAIDRDEFAGKPEKLLTRIESWN